MKKKALFLLVSLFIYSLSTGSILSAQDVQDPFLGDYIIGNSTELYILNRFGSYNSVSSQTVDFDQNLKIEPGIQEWEATSLVNMVVASGDFNADGYDDLITVLSDTMRILINDPASNTFSCIDSLDLSAWSIKLGNFFWICIGDFDYDPQKEFVLLKKRKEGYISQELEIQMFEVSDNLDLVEIGSYKRILPRDEHAKICVGNFDRDDIDEIVLVTFGLSGPWTSISVYTLDFEPGTTGLILKAKNDIDIQAEGFPFYNGFINFQIPLLASGDLDMDRRDEIAVFWQRQAYNKMETKKQLFIFEPTLSLDSINVVQDSFTDFETLKYPYQFAQSVACEDLNNDGRDEVIALGSYKFVIYESNDKLELTEKVSQKCNTLFVNPYRSGLNMLAIGDVNADTTQPFSTPEIILFTGYSIMEGVATTPLVLRVFEPKLTNGNITGLNEVDADTIIVSQMFVGERYCFAHTLGDFDGDAIRLGPPRLMKKEQVLQPILMLNAPPLHYDVFDGQTYDLCNAYPVSESKFRATYTLEAALQKSVSTELYRDWGVSTSLSAEGSFLGIGVKAKISTKYGEKFSKVEGSSHSIKVDLDWNVYTEDYVYGTLIDYYFLEYPVFANRLQHGYLMVVDPRDKGPTWEKSDNIIDPRFSPIHEMGNVLSYKWYDDISDFPDFNHEFIDQNFASNNNYFPTFSLSPGAEGNWSVTQTQDWYNETTSEREFGLAIGSSVEGWGIELDTEVNYNQSEISSHTTNFSNEFNLETHFDKLNGTLGSTVDYKVKPYIYWANNGALVLDYTVEPISDPNVPTWWDIYYGEYPDLTFILPRHYDFEKGELNNKELCYQTHDIKINPQNPSPGDTVSINSVIHNFSLQSFSDTIRVKYYMGDSFTGGELMTSAYGETEIVKPVSMEPRAETWMQTFYWIVPQNVTANCKIYAVIDEDDYIMEAHEDNNKGWRSLHPSFETGILAGKSANTISDFKLFQNYPNPFNPNTNIKFSISKSELVEIDIYNILGQKVHMLSHQRFPAGIHTIPFNASKLPNGLYFYRIAAGSYIDVKKMTILK